MQDEDKTREELIRDGTSPGIALTRRLVELHGGEIRAKSEGLGKDLHVYHPNSQGR